MCNLISMTRNRVYDNSRYRFARWQRLCPFLCHLRLIHKRWSPLKILHFYSARNRLSSCRNKFIHCHCGICRGPGFLQRWKFFYLCRNATVNCRQKRQTHLGWTKVWESFLFDKSLIVLSKIRPNNFDVCRSKNEIYDEKCGKVCNMKGRRNNNHGGLLVDGLLAFWVLLVRAPLSHLALRYLVRVLTIR